jgi:hypothetical protein
MRTRHLTQHGTTREGDAIDVLAQQNETLRALLDDWVKTEPPWGKDPETVITMSWDNGTVGKLILEHTAVALAARENVAGVLEDDGKVELARNVRVQAAQLRSLLNRFDEAGHGFGPMELARSQEFAETVRALRAVLEEDLGPSEGPVDPDSIANAMRDRRGDLQSARFLRKHAPAHPGRKRWYSNIPPLVRLHAAYDRIRGLPWAESSPNANPKISEQYNEDLHSN